jgi:predicted RNA-binding protein with TRAM domain
MTKKCPTCGGDGIVYSEASAAIDVERRLRALVAGSRSQAYRVELAAPIASALIGPGAKRLQELESMTKRRFFLDGKPDMHTDHFVVLAEGKLADLAPAAPVAEDTEIQVELVEIDRHDAGAAVGKVDGLDVCVAEAASLVGKRVKVRVERVLDGVAYATLVRGLKKVPEPLTAEAEAEKPTRKPPARKGAGAQAETVEAIEDGELVEDEPEEEPELDEDEDEPEETPEAVTAEAGAAPAKKKTRRGSRGGKNRKKPAGTAAAKPAEPAEPEAEAATEPLEPEQQENTEKKVTIHLPADDLGRKGDEADEAPAEAPSENGAATPAKKKTRRGSRGGKNRRKRTAATAGPNGAEPVASEAETEEPEVVEPEAAIEEPSTNGAPEDEWGYVPMSEWVDELES